MERHKETPRRFLLGESFGTSHHWCEQPVVQQVSQRSTMPTFLAVGNGVGGPQEKEALGD